MSPRWRAYRDFGVVNAANLANMPGMAEIWTLDAWMARSGRDNDTLGREVGRHPVTVSRWRSGQRLPPPKDLLRLHEIAPGVTFDWVTPILARRDRLAARRARLAPLACEAVA